MDINTKCRQTTGGKPCVKTRAMNKLCNRRETCAKYDKQSVTSSRKGTVRGMEIMPSNARNRRCLNKGIIWCIKFRNSNALDLHRVHTCFIKTGVGIHTAQTESNKLALITMKIYIIYKLQIQIIGDQKPRQCNHCHMQKELDQNKNIEKYIDKPYDQGLRKLYNLSYVTLYGFGFIIQVIT